MKTRLIQFIVLLLLLIGSAQLGQHRAAASNPPTWGQPVQISPDLPTSWFPDITSDRTGKFMLTWASNLSDDPESEANHDVSGAVMISQLGSDGWKTPGDIRVMDAGIASRPLLASDGTYAHMLYRTGVGGTTTLNYMRASLDSDLSNSHSWTEEQVVAENSYYAQILALPDQSIVILYNRSISIPVDVLAQAETPVNRYNLLTDQSSITPPVMPTLFARRSTDHGISWSQPVRISDLGKRVGRISLSASPDGSLLAASWDQGYDNNTGEGDPGTVATAVSKDQGKTWEHVKTTVSTNGPIEQSTIVTNGTVIVLAYRADSIDQLFFHVSTDGGATWTGEQRIPEAIARPYESKHTFDKLDLAVDGDGRIILAYVGRKSTETTDLSVMITTFYGSGWTSPIAIATPGGFPEYPRITVALGNQIQVAFFVRDQEFALGHYVMWSVSGHSDAKAIPATQPVPAPQSAAQAAATVAPVAIAQPPPVPTTPPHNFGETLSKRAPKALLVNPLIQAVGASLFVVFVLLIIGRLFRLVREVLGLP
jgi:hypothetical protein